MWTTSGPAMASADGRVVDGPGIEALERLAGGAAMRAQVHHAVVADQRDAQLGAGEQALAALQDLVEHGLRVLHRAR